MVNAEVPEPVPCSLAQPPMQHRVGGFTSWSQHELHRIFVSQSTEAPKSLYFIPLLHVLVA